MEGITAAELKGVAESEMTGKAFLILISFLIRMQSSWLIAPIVLDVVLVLSGRIPQNVCVRIAFVETYH